MIDPQKSWEIGSLRTIQPVSSYWGKTSLVTTSDGKFFILKEMQSLSQVEKEFNLLSRLFSMGASVAVPIHTKHGERYVSTEGKIYCLYPRLPGHIIEDHYSGDAVARARTFGKAIAFLHTCLAKCEGIRGFEELRLIEQIQGWALPCIRKNGGVMNDRQVEQAWKAFESSIISLDKDLLKQLIHRDLHPANMLFEEGELTGFVDFDLVVQGPRIFDLCYCGTSILASGFPDPLKLKKWPDLFRALVDGYQEVSPLTLAEFQAIPGTLAAIELLFMAFSLESHAEGAANCNASVLDWLSKNNNLTVRHTIS
jgi:Ser/Thr protein kinase RdoA (MazF antagonist)